VKFFFINFIFILLLTSCIPIATIFFGISKPKEVTTKDCIENNGLNAYAFYINLDVKEGWSDKIKIIMK